LLELLSTGIREHSQFQVSVFETTSCFVALAGFGVLFFRIWSGPWSIELRTGPAGCCGGGPRTEDSKIRLLHVAGLIVLFPAVANKNDLYALRLSKRGQRRKK